MQASMQIGQKQLTINATIQMDNIIDVYTWEAVYNDGTSLWECNSKGQVINKYSDIERKRVTQFRLYKTDERLDNELMKTLKPVYTIDIKEGRRLIWRKRRHQRLLESTPFLTIYIVGWQETIDGRNVQSIVYIYPDGRTELSERKSNGELDVVLFDFEEEDEQVSKGAGELVRESG